MVLYIFDFKIKCKEMIKEDDYEILKNSLVESKRLFSKLNIVADNIVNLDYDESGLYQDEEEKYERHWIKLSSKVVDAIQESLSDYTIELLKNESLEQRELTINLINNEVKSKIKIDYSESDSLNITQIS